MPRWKAIGAALIFKIMITYKTKNEIDILKEGGKILAHILAKLIHKVKPGTTTGELEDLACKLMAEAGGRPAFKGYRTKYDRVAFPTALCTSINDEVVHAPALPSRQLFEGDIIGIDLGMEFPFNKKGTRGMYTDMAATVAVGRIDPPAEKLLRTAEEALRRGLGTVRPGMNFEVLGRAIQDYAEGEGFSVVRDLVGHGVGYEVHEDPNVLNYVPKNGPRQKLIFKPGMVLAIEPMINIGGYKVVLDRDGQTIRTADGSLSAQFEHTIAVTDKGMIGITGNF